MLVFVLPFSALLVLGSMPPALLSVVVLVRTVAISTSTPKIDVYVIELLCSTQETAFLTFLQSIGIR